MQFTAFPKYAARIAAAIAIVLLPCIARANDNRDRGAGFVYAMTNKQASNSVIQFRREANGRLFRIAEASTRGAGSGGSVDPLGSQDSLVLDGTGRLLLAVNAGSNEVSVLGTGRYGLHFLSISRSGGAFPNSVALHRDLVYVLNSRGTPNVAGFRLRPDGTLVAIPGSIRNLPGGVGSAPADVKFSQDGTLLLVTETKTNQIDVFTLDDNGLISGATTMAAPGMTPFGFNFAGHGRPLITEANSGSVSSFNISDTEELETISAAVPDTQKASCWISITNSSKYAYVSNTGSGTLSSYQIGDDGSLTLLQAIAGNAGAGSAPIDSGLTDDSQYLYVLDSAKGRVVAFRAQGATLVPWGSVSGLPKSIQGIAVR